MKTPQKRPLHSRPLHQHFKDKVTSIQPVATHACVDPGRLGKILNGTEALSIDNAILLGHQLDYDPLFVAAAYFRDYAQCGGQAPSVGRLRDPSSVSRVQGQALEYSAEILSRYLKYANFHRSRGTRTGLTLTYIRTQRLKCKVNDKRLSSLIASELSSAKPCTREDAAAMLRDDESGRRRAAGQQWERFFDAFLAATSVITGARFDSAQFEEIAVHLKRMHRVDDTLEEDDRHDDQFLRWYCPDKPGYLLRYRRSRTIYGAMTIEDIEAQQPRNVPTGPIRVVNACHDGYELAILVEGRMRISLSQHPFPNEDPMKPPSFDAASLIVDDVYEAPDILCFPSGYWHRVELLSKRGRIRSINIRGNVILDRPGREVPTALETRRKSAAARRK